MAGRQIPPDVRERLRKYVWEAAEAADWDTLSPTQRADLYARWSADADVGGVISRYMPGRERVYIKDSLVKPYLLSRRADHGQLAATAAKLIGRRLRVISTATKPTSCLLQDDDSENRYLVATAQARAWKAAIAPVLDRSYDADVIGARHGMMGTRRVVILVRDHGDVRKTFSEKSRVEAIFGACGIEVVWQDA